MKVKIDHGGNENAEKEEMFSRRKGECTERKQQKLYTCVIFLTRNCWIGYFYRDFNGDYKNTSESGCRVFTAFIIYRFPLKPGSNKHFSSNLISQESEHNLDPIFTLVKRQICS